MTKIEILLIGFVIAVLAVTAAVSVITARSRLRDAVRISDIRQMQTGLELYFLDNNQYPVSDYEMPLGVPATACLNGDGFSASCSNRDDVYLNVVPSTPAGGLKEQVACGGYQNVYCYFSSGENYQIEFELENSNPLLGLGKGVNCATPTELVAGSCPTQ
ncbi:hypothetical protein D6827_01810 [Candidatus Parcubacteria bacterium]|nr:MAG: hypothetical protein D6827_01810 [Candidatus Parcubacteria bacterium]